MSQQRSDKNDPYRFDDVDGNDGNDGDGNDGGSESDTVIGPSDIDMDSSEDDDEDTQVEE